MKVSLNWVKEFIDIDIAVDELVEKIGRQLGEVESVENIGQKYQGIVVAEVVACDKHPNADKLSLCLIDDNGVVKDVERNSDGLVQVVCGAPNVRKGLKVAWLPPNTVVPSTVNKEPFKLEARELRGELSSGMLASGSELDISNDHDGIVELAIGDIGSDFAKEYMLEDEFIIDIENKMFTHRPDCFGILGVAREISGILGKQFPELRYTNWEAPETESSLELEVENKIPELVPRFTARVIEDVDPSASPAWVQARLKYAGIKPINRVVDITNYEMQETAQPLHAYDYDKLCKVAGTKVAKLETRLSRKGDKLKLLNGKTIKFEDDQTILITSNDVPVGIGGVMGGAETEVDENTTRIVLECANFDMYSIRRTSMRHGLFTDAVTRFNKGQSPLQCETVLNMATSRLAIGSKKQVKPGKMIDVFPEPTEIKTVKVSTEFINKRLGSDITTSEIQKMLKNVQFTVTSKDDELRISAPFWRTDIEIPEDIVEEVGRLYGYHNLPQQLPQRPSKPASRDQSSEFKNMIRKQLAAFGSNEVLTYSFIHGDVMASVGQDPDNAFQINNALSPDLQYYRQTLLPSLLEKIHPNVKRGYENFSIFEISKVHAKSYDKTDDLPNEKELLSVVYTSTSQAQPAYYSLKNIIVNTTDKLGLKLNFRELKDEKAGPIQVSYQLGRSADIYLNNKKVGQIGEFSPGVRRAFKLPDATAGLELDVDTLQKHATSDSNYSQLSVFPSVTQDISLKVPSDVRFSDIMSLLEDELLEGEDIRASLTPLDIFQKEEDNRHIQMTFRLEIAHHKKTLKSQEVNTMLDAAAARTNKEYKAERI